MSKRTIIIAFVAIVLFIAAIISALNDKKVTHVVEFNDKELESEPESEPEPKQEPDEYENKTE